MFQNWTNWFQIWILELGRNGILPMEEVQLLWSLKSELGFYFHLINSKCKINTQWNFLNCCISCCLFLTSVCLTCSNPGCWGWWNCCPAWLRQHHHMCCQWSRQVCLFDQNKTIKLIFSVVLGDLEGRVHRISSRHWDLSTFQGWEGKVGWSIKSIW